MCSVVCTFPQAKKAKQIWNGAIILLSTKCAKMHISHREIDKGLKACVQEH